MMPKVLPTQNSRFLVIMFMNVLVLNISWSYKKGISSKKNNVIMVLEYFSTHFAGYLMSSPASNLELRGVKYD